jgi:hypothetical protein
VAALAFKSKLEIRASCIYVAIVNSSRAFVQNRDFRAVSIFFRSPAVNTLANYLAVFNHAFCSTSSVLRRGQIGMRICALKKAAETEQNA